MKKLVDSGLSHDDVRRLAKIPTTWGAKITAEKFRQRASEYLPNEPGRGVEASSGIDPSGARRTVGYRPRLSWFRPTSSVGPASRSPARSAEMPRHAIVAHAFELIEVGRRILAHQRRVMKEMSEEKLYHPVEGVELTHDEWSQLTGLSSSLIRHRIENLEWSVQEALDTPAGVDRKFIANRAK
jgi:hypothetical protein